MKDLDYGESCGGYTYELQYGDGDAKADFNLKPFTITKVGSS